MPTSVPNFNFLAPLVTEIKRVSQNLMWGLLAPYRIPYAQTLMCAQSTWQDQTACQISASYVSLCIMQLCEYVFFIGFPLHVPQNEVFGGFEGEDVKILSSNPQKALPCVNTRLLMYRMSKSVQQPELYRSVERFCVQRNKKN